MYVKYGNKAVKFSREKIRFGERKIFKANECHVALFILYICVVFYVVLNETVKLIKINLT